MNIDEIIAEVTRVCKEHDVQGLKLIGSFATGSATPTSDVDFAVYGCKDILSLEDSISSIETLRKIDIFDVDEIKNPFLLEDIKKYGRQIY